MRWTAVRSLHDAEQRARGLLSSAKRSAAGRSILNRCRHAGWPGVVSPPNGEYAHVLDFVGGSGLGMSHMVGSSRALLYLPTRVRSHKRFAWLVALLAGALLPFA